MVIVSGIKLKPGFSDADIRQYLKNKYGINNDNIISLDLYKKSLDARDKGDIHYVASVLLHVKSEKSLYGKSGIAEYVEKTVSINMQKVFPENPPVIAGFGPSGMFAGLVLSKMGYKPVILERGKTVGERQKDIDSFIKTGRLDFESNVQFGAGGAGTFSDGKLTTGVKSEYYRFVLDELVRLGAPKEILYEQKPHIGTDNLRKIVDNIGGEIEALGGRILFNTRLDGIGIRNGAVYEARTNGAAGSQAMPAESIILGIGHSARDTYRMLSALGAAMEQKPFSIGVRIEHLQSEINKSQYGKYWDRLPAADYKLNCKAKDGRGVYTFCMCPGGVVIPAASEDGGVVTNGMSYYKRDLPNANSALLVDVYPSDFKGANALSGIDFQREYENKAFNGAYKAQCQLVGDFIKGQKSSGPGRVIPSYGRGIVWGEVESALPGFAADGIREALILFDKRLKGFAAADAVLTAAETRSSAPLRVLRGEDMQSVNIKGLYPCGEGCGYAGGIISAALDGIRAANAIGAGK